MNRFDQEFIGWARVAAERRFVLGLLPFLPLLGLWLGAAVTGKFVLALIATAVMFWYTLGVVIGTMVAWGLWSEALENAVDVVLVEEEYEYEVDDEEDDDG